MNRNKRIGIILIIVGVCLPLVALAFVDYYSPKGGFIYNMQYFMDIELDDTELPYRYIFILGIILTGTGVGLIVLSRPKGKEVNH